MAKEKQPQEETKEVPKPKVAPIITVKAVPELVKAQDEAEPKPGEYLLVRLDKEGRETGKPFSVSVRSYNKIYASRADKFKVKKNPQ